MPCGCLAHFRVSFYLILTRTLGKAQKWLVMYPGSHCWEEREPEFECGPFDLKLSLLAVPWDLWGCPGQLFLKVLCGIEIMSLLPLGKSLLKSAEVLVSFAPPSPWGKLGLWEGEGATCPMKSPDLEDCLYSKIPHW